MRHSFHSTQTRGFTLLEVLIALFILAMAILAIVKTTGGSAASTGYLKEKTYAHWVAMNQMEELRIKGDWLRVGTQSGEVEMFGTEWRWLRKVSKSPNEFTEKGMRIVEISVILAEEGDEDHPLVTLTGFLTNPGLLTKQ